jgi:hypothetical protein
MRRQIKILVLKGAQLDGKTVLGRPDNHVLSPGGCKHKILEPPQIQFVTIEAVR